MITAQDFVARMERHWTTDLGNACNRGLKEMWYSLGLVFNDAIADQAGSTWRIVAAPTGIGKSVGAAVHAAMTTGPDAPGVLIVTRFVQEALELANRVNAIYKADTGCVDPIALDYHRGHRDPRTGVVIPDRKDKSSPGYVDPATLQSWPVLITTHRGLETSYDFLEQGIDTPYTALTAFNGSLMTPFGGGRRLVVVDESIDVVKEAVINSPNLGVLRSVLDAYPKIVKKYPKQMALIDAVIYMMRVVTLGWLPPGERPAHAPKSGEVPLAARGLIPANAADIDFRELRRELKSVRFDQHVLRHTNGDENRRMREEYDEVLDDLSKVLSQWSWALNDFKGGPSLTTSFQLIPEGVRRGVILDASASLDAIYRLFTPEQAKLISLPPNPRKYNKVTWRVSTDHKVGVVSLRDSAEHDVPRVIDALEDALPASTKLLIVCHADVEKYFAAYISDPAAVSIARPEGIKPTKFAALDVAHWGDLNGKNQWRDFDALLTYGLPYRPRRWAKNMYQAFHGPQSLDWHNSPGDRPYLAFKDIVRALIAGKNVADTLQAFNRIACRRMTDADGSCPPCTIFSVLPSSKDKLYADGTVKEDAEATAIAKAIGEAMPGIVVKPWKLDVAKRAIVEGRPSNHFEKLIRFCQRMEPGSVYVASVVRDECMIPAKAWEHICKNLRDKPEHRLTVRLADMGVRYYVEGSGGRGRVAYISKKGGR